MQTLPDVRVFFLTVRTSAAYSAIGRVDHSGLVEELEIQG